MAQITSQPSDTLVEHINIQVDDPGLDFERAKELAKKAALGKTSMPMLLSWKNGIDGSFYPTFECGKSAQPPWIVFAKARGANLTVEINGGDYVFMFLKL